MDTFARALIAADQILRETDYLKMKRERYASFDTDKGAAFENGDLNLEDLRMIAEEIGHPEQISGKQEKLEQLISMYL